MNHQPLILASQSPRRKYLLEQAGLAFKVVPSQIDENAFSYRQPATHVKKLALAKAEDVAMKNPGKWIIGADTIVFINASILEKPTSKDNARAMLQQLSGKIHQVFTGFAICNPQQKHVHVNYLKTDVNFKILSDAEIEWYLKTEEPYDKAGGYAIQGLGASLIKQINGSYTNVVGLPICEVIEHLISAGVVIR
ncbi:Maf family protein [Desulfococcaceae bacterium HSG9]|nr:Maf family protein [Desulfococcaceae bacterium HSG9]